MKKCWKKKQIQFIEILKKFNIHKYQSFLYFLGVYFSLFFCLAISIPIFMAEEMEVQVLREKYATQHAVGVVAWMEFDSKVENEQKLAALKMGA